jgi:hypothetical protein
MRADQPDMNLPPGKTCADCAHVIRCTWLFSVDRTNTHCDWSPSRFRLRVAVADVPEESP